MFHGLIKVLLYIGLNHFYEFFCILILNLRLFRIRIKKIIIIAIVTNCFCSC